MARSSSTPATKAKTSSDPLAQLTRSTVAPWRAAIQARRPLCPPGEYESATTGSRSIAVASAARMSSTGSMSALGTPRVNGIASAMPAA